MAQKKMKAAAIVAVPQTREEAVRQLGAIGELRRGIERVKALADAQVKAIGEQLEAEIAPIREELAAHEKGLQTWCEAHRAELTAGNRVKFVELGTGKVSWRTRPPKVTIRGAEAVMEAIKRLSLLRFIRTKEEIDKDALLKEPQIAMTIAGVSIGSEGEDFMVEPVELRVEKGSAP